MTPAGPTTLLFLGASISQQPAIRHARRRGYRVVAVDGDPQAVAFADADIAVVGDFSDVELVVAAARRNDAQGLLAISTDRAVLPAALGAELLGLPGIGPDVARGFTHKATMRARLAEAGVPQPRFAVIALPDDVATAGVPYPAVLKPADSGGQRGVFVVRSAREAQRRLPETLELSRSGRAMLEEFVDGTELNGIVVVRRGVPQVVTLSDRLRPRGPGFGVGWIHSYPSSLPAAVLAEVGNVAMAAVGALGLRDGIGFPQLIAARDGVRVVEVAARIPAGQMADLVRFATGIDLFDVAFAQALGEAVPDELVTPEATRPIAIRFLTAKPGLLPAGTVESVEGVERVRKAPGVLAADLYFGVGETIRPVQVDADRRGYIVATGSSAAEALALADRAGRQLVVRVRAKTGRLRRPTAFGGLRRWALAASLVAAVAGVSCALVLRSGAAPLSAFVTSARFRERLEPFCACRLDVARLTFRVLRSSRLDVAIVSSDGARVVTLERDRVLSPGLQHLRWRGQVAGGRWAVDGVYRPELVFDTLHRTLALPGSIDVQDGAGVAWRGRRRSPRPPSTPA